VTWEDNWPGTVTDANGSPYAKAIASNQCPNKQIGPGTWLDTDPGAGSGQTRQPIADFCRKNGGTNPPNGNPANFDCIADPKVKLVIWDIYNGSPGSNLQYRVKYVGVFSVTRFSAGTGQNADDQVYGYFSSMPTTGGFTGSVGPTFKGAIVY
jgi:hypothetical protein